LANIRARKKQNAREVEKRRKDIKADVDRGAKIDMDAGTFPIVDPRSIAQDLARHVNEGVAGLVRRSNARTEERFANLLSDPNYQELLRIQIAEKTIWRQLLQIHMDGLRAQRARRQEDAIRHFEGR
ncbi:hypothetical protein LCGC14_2561400, partial [marine sediment metagenome]